MQFPDGITAEKGNTKKLKIFKRGKTMSMRGQIISEEYNRMVWVRDPQGKEYVCYKNDLKSPDHVSDSEKDNCFDTSQLLGPNW